MESTKIIVREFAECDGELVKAFFNQMSGETRAFFDRNRGNFLNAMKFFEGQDINTIRWMAVENDRMIGYVFLWETDKSIPWLGIAVAEDSMGKNLGRLLLQKASEYCLSHGKGGVFLTTHIANLRAQSLYEKFGYERLGIHNCGEILYALRFSEK